MIGPGSQLGGMVVREVLSEDPALPTLLATDGARPVRVRALALELAPPTELLAELEAGLAAAARLAHPGILAPTAWSTSPPLYVASAHLEGASVADRLSERGALAPGAVVALGAEVASALAAAHAAGLTHGGLGARTVLVTAEGEVRLTDFGIEALAARLSSLYSQLLPSVVSSLAPEHVSGGGSTAASDVFALGVLVYRLLAGTYPFAAPSPLAVTLKLSMGSYEPLPPTRGLPDAVREGVHRMLSVTPADRPRADEVARLFHAHAPHEHERRDAVCAAFGLSPALAAPAPAPAPPSAPPPSAPPPAASLPLPFAPLAATGFGGPPASPPRPSAPPLADDELPPVGVGFDDAATELQASPRHDPRAPAWVAPRGVGFDDGATELAPPPRLPDEDETPSTAVLPFATLPDARARAVEARPASGGVSPLVWGLIGVGALVALLAAVALAVALAG